ncbi:uncharacterized protein LOC133299870 [Gastrolobium bilobum]|uniref:uncharacterized protein LOC133299870 n=1 Tax=Gastrolobium bilobum TaxID=150636 RepID=UPI002AB2F957|nr:uncharacterized protein LOC133299870 [Gastrolobium bilobum]
MSPYQAVFGKPPIMIPFYPRGMIKLEAIDTMLQQRNEILAQLKLHLQRAQNRMKVQFDKHHKEHSFNIGDQDRARLQPYRQVTVERRANHKLAKRFFGSFEFLRRLGATAYELKLPSGSQIHPVFHVSQLKPCVGPLPIVPNPLPSSTVDNRPVQVPVAILGMRHVSCHGSLWCNGQIRFLKIPRGRKNRICITITHLLTLRTRSLLKEREMLGLEDRIGTKSILLD